MRSPLNISRRGRTGVVEKVDISFQEAVRNAEMQRVREGIDMRPRGFPRMTKAIFRHPAFKNSILPDLTKAEFIDDNSAQLTNSPIFNIFIFMIVSFVAILFFAGLVYVMGLLNTTMHEAGLSNEVNAGQPGYANLTLAADQTFGQLNSSIQALRLVALTLIFSLIIGTFVINALLKVHPAFFFVYVLIVMLAVFLAAPISNAYQTMLGSGVFGGLLPSFTGANWIMLNLPVVTLLTGILGGIFLFVNILKVGNPEALV